MNAPKTSTIATEPIINIGKMPGDNDISWVVRDDENIETPVEPLDKATIEDIEREDEKPEQEDETHVEQQDESHDEEPTVERKKSNKNPPAKRIAEITRKYKNTQAELAEAKAREEYYLQQLTLKEEEKVQSEAKIIGSELKNIERAYSEALSEGDHETATKAASLMAQYTARQESLAQQKYAMELNRKNTPRPQVQYEENELDDLGEEFQNNGKAWISQNPWADSGDPKNFSPRLLQKAEAFAEELMDLYKLEGRGEEIGSPDYFNEITQHVRGSFSVNSPSRPQKDKLVMKGDGTPGVAPVNRTSNMPNIERSKQQVVLSPEEKAFAHSMAGKVTFDGQRITDKAKLEKIYLGYKTQQSKQG